MLKPTSIKRPIIGALTKRRVNQVQCEDRWRTGYLKGSCSFFYIHNGLYYCVKPER